jgi:hypothetical protein
LRDSHGRNIPQGFLTEAGLCPEFAAEFGAEEMASADYVARTIANVNASDVTIWLGTIASRGFRTTHDAGLRREVAYPFFIAYQGVTKPSNAVAWIRSKNIGILNVSDNRESVNAGIGDRAERFLRAVFRQLGHRP